MGVQTPVQPDYSSQSGTVYPTNIDKALAVLKEVGDQFAPYQDTGSNLQALVAAGRALVAGALVSQAVQTVTGFTATSATERIDRIVLDMTTLAASRVAGTESAAPAAPAIPASTLPCCQIGPFTTSTTAIVNSMITDERVLWSL